MKYINLTKDQLADNFERVAKDFYKFIEDNGLNRTRVNMGVGEDRRETELNLCDTPACHGGWAAIMYGIKGESHEKDFYELGAGRLAEELGFEERRILERWAEEYPEYWGNREGEYMFSAKWAFSKGYHGNLSLKDIADWYMNVAKRLRGEDV